MSSRVPTNQLINELRYVRAELERLRELWHDTAVEQIAESDRCSEKNPQRATGCEARAQGLLQARRDVRNAINFIENVPGVIEAPAPKLRLVRTNHPRPNEETS